jgi:hypothetical protein
VHKSGYTNLNTALAQLNYASGTLPAGGVQLYRVSPSGTPFLATTTWNRHVSGGTSYFNNIGLHLYELDNGAELSTSTDVRQNV